MLKPLTPPLDRCSDLPPPGSWTARSRRVGVQVICPPRHRMSGLQPIPRIAGRRSLCLIVRQKHLWPHKTWDEAFTEETSADVREKYLALTVAFLGDLQKNYQLLPK
jgi:hypothetical protein